MPQLSMILDLVIVILEDRLQEAASLLVEYRYATIDDSDK